ncbi:MAG: N-6 DNA methylase, partial [Candidatus Rokubacteria bacterium]|nr:N-6 DNA methylase [Candidatus Rokubacteria bacterium]
MRSLDASFDSSVRFAPVSPNIRPLIKEVRERLQITQEQLAPLLKVSLPTISRWENGRSQPDAMAFHVIEEFLRARGPQCADLLASHFGEAGAARPATRRRRRTPSPGDGTEPAPNAGTLDTRSMEGMLWKAARLAETYGDEATARAVLEADHSLVRFYIPPEAAWPVVSRRRTFDWPESKRPRTLGEQLTYTVRAIARANPSLQGVIDIVDYNETRNGEREISDDALSRLIELLSDPRYRLGLKDVEPDFLGRAYEYLLRKFAEGQGQSAGEFFTPKEVGWLIARVMRASQGDEIYDPCCGSGGLLIKCQLALVEREPALARPPRLHGQELTGASFAIARMNMVLHDMEGEIVRGNTMSNPKFLEGSSLKQFDIVVTNPMWNQDNFDPAAYESDPYERFAPRGGFAPGASADWAWLQHVLASLKETGRAAVVVDTGAASRGSGNQGENREKAIRRWFVEQDAIEGVILLPDNLFYNTTAAGIIVVLNRAKPADRRGKVVLVNASAEFQKGRPKNFIPDDAITKIAGAFHAGNDVERLVKVASAEEIASNDYNLSPSRYVETATATEHRDI